MRKLLLSLSLLAALVGFNACSTKVDLYADYKDIPIIYGLLDVTADTNYVRINRAYSSNNDNPIDANEVAMIADSCNYPGKLDARIIEYKNVYGNQYEPTGREILLDTITIHNKQEGVFYAPDQKVYFTHEQLKQNTVSHKYMYKLRVLKGNDTITSETALVGGDEFKIITTQVSFTSKPTSNAGKITFKPADNAVFYDVRMQFNYKELKGGSTDTIHRQVNCSIGTKSVDELTLESGSYAVSYGENLLFNLMESAIGGDTINVKRYFGDFIVSIAAGGEELYNYIQVNAPTSGFSQTIPDYTNISGGYGVFSSRINLNKKVRLSARAQADLYGKPWGFEQQ